MLLFERFSTLGFCSQARAKRVQNSVLKMTAHGASIGDHYSEVHRQQTSFLNAVNRIHAPCTVSFLKFRTMPFTDHVLSKELEIELRFPAVTLRG